VVRPLCALRLCCLLLCFSCSCHWNLPFVL
jgi:hypothetical protein